MVWQGELHGVFPYLVSPLDEAGTVMRDVLANLVEHLIEAGVHGLTPLGSTGEFAYLNREQRLEIVDVVVQATRGRVPVIAGVAATTTREAVALARAVMERGADGVLAVLEAYFPVSEHGVERSALVRRGSMARSALARSIRTPLRRHLRRRTAQRPWREGKCRNAKMLGTERRQRSMRPHSAGSPCQIRPAEPGASW